MRSRICLVAQPDQSSDLHISAAGVLSFTLEIRPRADRVIKGACKQDFHSESTPLRICQRMNVERQHVWGPPVKSTGVLGSFFCTARLGIPCVLEFLAHMPHPSCSRPTEKGIGIDGQLEP